MSEAALRRIATFLERTLQLTRAEAILRARLMSSAQLADHHYMMLHGLSPKTQAVNRRKLTARRRSKDQCVECGRPSLSRRCEGCRKWKGAA